MCCCCGWWLCCKISPRNPKDWGGEGRAFPSNRGRYCMYETITTAAVVPAMGINVLYTPLSTAMRTIHDRFSESRVHHHHQSHPTPRLRPPRTPGTRATLRSPFPFPLSHPSLPFLPLPYAKYHPPSPQDTHKQPRETGHTIQRHVSRPRPPRRTAGLTEM